MQHSKRSLTDEVFPALEAADGVDALGEDGAGAEAALVDVGRGAGGAAEAVVAVALGVVAPASAAAVGAAAAGETGAARARWDAVAWAGGRMTDLPLLVIPTMLGLGKSKNTRVEWKMGKNCRSEPTKTVTICHNVRCMLIPNSDSFGPNNPYTLLGFSKM